MTIQESLLAKYRKSDYLAFGSWIVLVVISFLHINWLSWLKVICALLFMGSGFYMVFFIQCPQCKLSVFRTTLKNKPISLKRVPENCMGCGCNYLAEEIIDIKNQTKDN